jgi:hypothetical protein
MWNWGFIAVVSVIKAIIITIHVIGDFNDGSEHGPYLDISMV